MTYRFAHPVIDDWMLEPLSHDVAGVIRHELEHNRQGPTVSYANIEKTRAYLLNPREVEAVGTQMYLQAKREKVAVRSTSSTSSPPTSSLP